MSPLASVLQSGSGVAPECGTRSRVAAAWVLAGVATAADVLTTVFGVGAGLAEGNPVVANTLATAGIPGFLAVKACIVVAVASIGARYFESGVVAPAALALAWGGAAAVNTVVLLGVASGLA